MLEYARLRRIELSLYRDDNAHLYKQLARDRGVILPILLDELDESWVNLS